MKNVIEIKNLSKNYDKFKLNNVNLDIQKGSIVGLVGQNGAGKTTLIKLILEIINKDNGDINIFGNQNIKNSKEKIGVVLDQAFFPELLKINDIKLIFESIYKNWDNDLFNKYLKDFNLTDNKALKELSTGMRKKLEIACALSHHPDLLILDEPTSGLDPVVRSEILDIFLDFVKDENHTILLSSHITSDLESVSDYIVFINDGNIIFNKSIEELKEDFAIIKCSKEDFDTIDSKDIINYKKNKYDYEVLISNKKEAKKKYKNLVIDSANIESIMLLFVKGEIK